MAKENVDTKAQADFADFSQFADDLKGYEGLDMSTMAIPFIRIIQALSPQVKKNKPEFIAGAEVGDVCNSINGRVYPLPMKVVVGKFERLFIEWKPQRGGFVQAHNPETIENNPKYVMNEKYQLVDPETKNEFIDTYMYYVILPDYMEDGICIMSMTSTQLKEARKLNRLLMTSYLPGTARKALPHWMVWNFDAIEMSNDKGDWYTPSFKFDTFVSQAQLEYVETERKALPDKKIDFAQLDENAGKSGNVVEEEGQVSKDAKY